MSSLYERIDIACLGKRGVWWKGESGEIFHIAGKRLLGMGMPEDEIPVFLGALYQATEECFS